VLAVAAATCDPLWLGIDVERLRPVSAGLAARVLAPAELEQLGAVCSPDLAPLLGFSAKEAVYKAVFPVLRRVLGFHEVVLEAEGPGALRAHVPADRIEGVEVRLTCEHGLVLAGAAFER
jgi:4'-phosphopantetheinyl transferase EntD